MDRIRQLRVFSWLLVVVTVALAVMVWWGERMSGGKLTMYNFFPLLGIVAFSIMWTHYISGSIRRKLGVEAKENKTYLTYSSWIVLALILLHPGLLIYQLNRDGFGLPPKSYLTVYAEPAMKIAIGFGTISLLIFLAFEFKKKFEKKSWWKFIEYAQLLATGLIFYHGLTLGRELSVPWYHMLWFFYGISFVAAVVFNHWYDSKVKKRG